MSTLHIWHWIYQGALLFGQKTNFKSECIISDSQIMPVSSNTNFSLEIWNKSHRIQSFAGSYLGYREKVLTEGSKCVHRPQGKSAPPGNVFNSH